MPESRSRTTDKRFFGVYEAIVTEVNDPSSQGRAQVKFPWFDEEMVSEWCRVRQFYAGNNYGAFFVPEVGDEVLVAFIQGDMRLPVILGGLYNGQDKPPSARTADKDQKMIRTKGQHEILMDDSKNQERIRIKTKGGHQITLDDINGAEKISIIDSKEKNRVEIDSVANSIKIESSGGKLVLKAKEIEIKADTTLKVEAGGEMTIKGATVNIN
ncbi:MAG TPA: phage baseplate assembly protein V [Pyrinomonadaceae bacterium]|nr:phage baseplate assembly protein V [Pyrinomonadaceae bacterium]